MSKQEKIEYIREKAIEANPDIKKLEFGCEVKYRNQEETYRFIMENPLVCMQCVCTTGVHIEGLSDKSPQSFCKHRFEEWFEIIGRPIRLADVLLALKESEHRTEVGLNFNLDGAYLYYDDFENASGSKYNLKQDDLTLQPPETIDFLYSLLNKED
jgi:hypothetical protein